MEATLVMLYKRGDRDGEVVAPKPCACGCNVLTVRATGKTLKCEQQSR